MLEDFISSALRSTTVVAVMLIVFGVFLYIADRLPKLQKQISDLSLGNAMVIGFAQALALIPGVSRSGITIIAGLTQKLNRETAARFSFLLSIPIVFGAGLKKIIELLSSGELISSDIGLLVVGFLTSALVGMVCIKYFLKFLQRHTLRGFAYYRIGLGLVLLLAAFL
jgi:undecaprenyl-diphosphatase